MDESNHAIRDYYLFPALDQVALRLRLAECNSALLDTYRFDDLGVLLLPGRTHLLRGRRMTDEHEIQSA
jgi:hypothetical protein